MTSTSKPPPGKALGGPLTVETMRSGPSPMPMLPPAAALLVSSSSLTASSGSTTAPSV
ncbi:hypothetical protein [Sorangium cellulosum]|uniref:hypothetical protein n=1 Tax=Sorangium cellulosum TaxID=56 RepID=UPI00165105D8|nr:hypothetical protein [Sorangium cellulosum]